MASVFIQPDLLPSIIGKTNVSLDLSGKEILIFQSNELRKKIYNPLIAAIIESAMNVNFSYQRTTPLVASLDEYITIKIEDSVDWANWHRSKGLVLLIGYQNESQVIKRYEKEDLSAMQTGLKAKFLFNPLNSDNEAKWSKILGEKEVIIKNKSTSYGGNKSGKSTTKSEQLHLTPLLKPDDIRGMSEGAAIYTNPELKKGKRGNIPWKIDRVRVSKKDIKIQDECERVWFSSCLNILRDREKKRLDRLNLELELNKRIKLAEVLLPLPPQEAEAFDLDTTI